MPMVRDVLVNVDVEQVQRQRNATHLITNGEMCLVATGPTNDDYSYSRDAAKAKHDAVAENLYAGHGPAPPD